MSGSEVGCLDFRSRFFSSSVYTVLFRSFRFYGIGRVVGLFYILGVGSGV